MPRATLRTRCGREVAIAYTLHSIETISEAALQGRVAAPHSALAKDAIRGAAAGAGSQAEADIVAEVLDARPRGQGIFSTRSFDKSEAANDSNRREATPASPSVRGLANGPSGDAASNTLNAGRQGSLGIAMAPLDSSSGDVFRQGAPESDLARRGSTGNPVSGSGHSSDADSGQARPRTARDPQRLLVLGGMGARGDNGWFNHVVDHIASLRQPSTGHGAAVVCTMDYRGIGGSTIFKHFWEYSTGALAADALALLEHLGWERTHLIGMSLGAMVACQMMCAAPERVASATLLGTTLTGWEMLIPLHLHPVRLAKLMFGTRGMQLRATLPFYFSKGFLDQPAGLADMGSPDYEDLKGVKMPHAHFFNGKFSRPSAPPQKSKEQALLNDMSREEVIMRASALAVARGQSNRFADWDQPPTGRRGHLWATGHHWLHSKESRRIVESGIPIHIIHGSADPLATLFFARRVQRRLRCKFTLTEASHAGITVESCTVVLPALETAMFGRTISDADTWRRRQEQATANVVCNPFFLSL